MSPQRTETMMRLICLIAGAIAIATSSVGCAITYPIVRSQFGFASDGSAVQNGSFLVSNSPFFPRYRIQAKTPYTGMVGELPEGTGVAFRSFWRLHSWGPESGWRQKDYAIVTVDSPTVGTVNAILFASEFDNVFNGNKYRPKPATGESNDPLDD
jgi:hypothetical protein